MLLTLVTIIWGATFLVTRQALRFIHPFTFLTLRFSFASVVLVPLFYRRLRGVCRTELIQGVSLGLILFTTLALQTVGARLTTASEAGFLVGLSVPVVPLIGLPVLRKLPSIQAVGGIALSFAGLTLISMNGHFGIHPGKGEYLMIGAAITTALHIVVVSKYAPNSDAINLAIVQIITAAALSLAALCVCHEPRCAPAPAVLVSAVLMGLFATAFALVAMSHVQQTVCATKATLIYALEPVWAGGLGLLAGETLRASTWGGCGLIFTGIVVGSLRLKK
jgi:drug/metabolite transporter (DMT)-like permease